MPHVTKSMFEDAVAAFERECPDRAPLGSDSRAGLKAAIEAALDAAECHTPGGCRDPIECHCGAWG